MIPPGLHKRCGMSPHEARPCTKSLIDMRCPFALVLLLALPAAAQADVPDWTPAGSFSSTMNIVATLHFDGAAADYPSDLLAAFVGGEPRGLGVPVRLGSTSNYVFFLTIGSNAVRDGETITFKAYDASTDTERTLCESLTFRDGSSRGTPGTPFALHTDDGASLGTCPLYWTAPAGFTRQMIVNAAVYFEGILSADPQDRVAAFVGKELRGVGDPVTDPNGDQYHQMVVWGDVAGEAVTFQTYDASRLLTYAPAAMVRFAANTLAGTASNPLVLDAVIPLPVELTAFTATRDGPDVRLAWTTASETNNAGFEVHLKAVAATADEVSPPDGWRTLAFVEGHGTTAEIRQYGYTIEDLSPGRYRFRLQQRDFDGAASYSTEVEVTIAVAGAFSLSEIHPNPFRHAVRFTLSVAHTQQVRIRLYDLLGRAVGQIYEGLMEENGPYPLHLDGADLPAGLYVVNIEGERFSTSRVITRLR